MVFRDLKEYFTKTGIIEYTVSPLMWKIRFQTPTGVKISCSLLKVDDFKFCVEFTRRAGDLFAFNECYSDIAKHLTIHNDAVL